MISFLRRFRWPIALGVLGFTFAVLLGAYLEPFKEGFNPYAMIMKGFAKCIYLMAAIMMTHFVVKKWFPTVYRYCQTNADEDQSCFQNDWSRTNGTLNPKVNVAINVHIGVFIGVCVLLALAF
jgi:hypothetical protein